MMFLLSILPVVLLVFLMVKPNPWPAPRSFLVVCLFTLLLCFFAFDFSATHIAAVCMKGFLTSYTPILIIFGAVVLFRCLEVTGGMDEIRRHLNQVSQQDVAQLMIIGWAFPFLIEGASGFGTPAALAAPILIALGFDPLRSVILALVFNSVPVSFGAVGTPIWFGLSALELPPEILLDIGVTTAWINGLIALPLPFIALRVLLPWKTIWANKAFILGATLAPVIPYVACSYVSFEFPALLGGFVGLGATLTLAKKGMGLKGEDIAAAEKAPASDIRALLFKSFPLWGVLVLLLLTRIKEFGIKPLLMNAAPMLRADVGPGELFVTPSLSVGWTNIFGQGINWIHHTLYVPSLIPFFLVCMIAFWLYRTPIPERNGVLLQSLKRMNKASLTLHFALIFVGLMMMGGEDSAVSNLGKGLSAVFGNAWIVVAPLLGALGSFFSGSATISNLTFAPVQAALAEANQLPLVLVLAQQSVGAALGNMICINNIIAACSIVGLYNVEGPVLRQTIKPMLAGAVVAGVVGLLVG